MSRSPGDRDMRLRLGVEGLSSEGSAERVSRVHAKSDIGRSIHDSSHGRNRRRRNR